MKMALTKQAIREKAVIAEQQNANAEKWDISSVLRSFIEDLDRMGDNPIETYQMQLELYRILG